jgi:hypothetical protein
MMINQSFFARTQHAVYWHLRHPYIIVYNYAISNELIWNISLSTHEENF